MTHYDEAEVLYQYLHTHHTQHFTFLESLVARHLLIEQKAAHMKPESARVMRRRLGANDDPAVHEALANGVTEFKRRLCERVLLESPHLEVNRCPSCNRILWTPVAKQCLWCGHDWH